MNLKEITAPTQRNQKGTIEVIIIVVIVVVLLFAFLVWLLLFKGDDQDVVELPQQALTSIPMPTTTPETLDPDEETLYPCTSTTNAQLTSFPEYDEMGLFVSTDESLGMLGSSQTILEEFPATSLSDFKEQDWPEHDVVYRVTKDMQFFTGFWGVDTGMEVCDENNMTNEPLDDLADVRIIPEDQPAASAASYIHGGHKPALPGTYRVDAYLFSDGQWHLTDQMENIVFTE